MAADEAFARLRGPGYERALAAARFRGAALPHAAPAIHPLVTTWTAIGPQPISGGMGGNDSGRLTGLALAGSTIYAATAGGGVWSSTNNGTSWTTNTDSQANIAMGAVAVDPSDASYVFAGAGEDNSCGDCYFGDGVRVSTDGGGSWGSPGSGIPTPTSVASIVVEPGAGTSLSTTKVLAGTDGGLYVSANGGTSWTRQSGGGWHNGNVYSVVINPDTSPISIYAGVAGVGVEESTDNGTTWSTLGSGTLPSTGPLGAIALAIAPNSSPAATTLYASFGDATNAGGVYRGMFKSTDGGASWTQLTIPFFTSADYGYYGINDDKGGDQSWYDNVVAIDPSNPNIVAAAGIATIESTDGGSTWVNLNTQGFFQSGHAPFFHSDFHALAFDASQNLYMGNDGGIWEANAVAVENPNPTNLVASNFLDRNGNLDITQFYGGMAQASDTALVLGGSQDNGTALYSSPNTTWSQMAGGDGGASAIDPANSQIAFAEVDVSVGGELGRTTDGGATNTNVTPPFTRANWAPPVVISPPGSATTTGLTVFFGGERVYQSTDGGTTWLTPPASAYGASRVSAIAVAPSNTQVVYAGFDNGVVQVSKNGGSTWTTIVSAGSPTTNGEWVTHIAVNPTDPATAYLTLSTNVGSIPTGPSAPDVLQGSTLTTSPTWVNESANLPTGVPTNSVVPDGGGGLIVADDAGVYWASSLNGASTSWSSLGTGLPDVQVMDLVLTPNNTLLADTHGRGAWTMPFSNGKQSQSITFSTTPPNNATVAGPPYTVGATASSSLPVAFTIDTSTTNSACSISGTTVSFTGGAGTCVIDANQAGDSNYNPAPQVQQSFAVASNGKQSQSITFTTTPPSNATVGGPSYTVGATASSSLPVTITIDSTSTSVCSISGSSVSFTATGTCVIEGNQAGDGTYNPAPQAQQSFAVGASCPGGFAITTSSLPGATKGNAYSTDIMGCGGKTPYKFKRIGKLPKGLVLASTGVISGVPKKVGSSTFSVKLTDNAKPKHSATKAFTITVS